MKRETRHIPVLLNEVLEALDPQPGQTVVDCTLGLGGHAVELLRRVAPGGKLIGLDFDSANIERARANLETVGGEFSLHHSNFAALPDILAAEGIEEVDAILADVGVASPQIDDPARGFSYRKPGPLDMRMDPSRGQAASVLVNRMSEREIAEALLELGDETDAPKIAKLIVERRKSHPIETTEALTKIVCDARDFTLQRAAGAKLHPAARTFQALRMLVNRELPNLERLLTVAPQCLKPGGRIAIISFHSGEDRIVKKSFREGKREEIYNETSDDPVTATEAEQQINPRSRSAKLRWAILRGAFDQATIPAMNIPTWLLYAIGAAVCASLINVLAKFGMKDVDKDFATAVRSVVQAMFVVGFAAVVGVLRNFGQLHGKAAASVVLTGICGGLSWIFAFRAIQLADVSKVAPIDKLSMPLGIILAVILLHERPTWINWIGILFITGGAYLATLPKH